MELPKSAAEAKALGQSYYFTGNPCKYGHICKRIAVNATCHECSIAGHSAYWKRNKEKLYAQQRKYETANREQTNQRVRQYREMNLSRVRELERIRHNTRRAELTDSYILGLLLKGEDNLQSQHIPPTLIELKRSELKLKRLIRNPP